MNDSADFETVRKIKETHCFVSHDLDIDKKIAYETCSYKREYLMPDKTRLILDRERFLAPEILFTPSIADPDKGMGVAQLTYKAITGCPGDCVTELF